MGVVSEGLHHVVDVLVDDGVIHHILFELNRHGGVVVRCAHVPCHDENLVLINELLRS